jgi:hypothetical protein
MWHALTEQKQTELPPLQLLCSASELLLFSALLTSIKHAINTT